MKKLTHEEAIEEFNGGGEVWFCTGEMNYSGEGRHLEDKIGTVLMTCLSEDIGDTVEDICEDTNYFYPCKYYYMVNKLYASRFLDLYTQDRFTQMILEKEEHKSMEPMFIESNKLIDGYVQISYYSVGMLLDLGLEFKQI